MEIPRLAVTTVLLRPAAAEVEVLLVRRPKTMRAFGDMWVFPGGQVDPADDSPQALALIPDSQRDASATRFLAPDAHCPDPPVLPLFTAAVRELFEEAGVLLARHAGGAPVDVADVQALAQARDSFLADGTGFYAELARRGLRFSPQGLLPWSRWITPPGTGRRFDTIFFVTVVDAGTLLLPHAGEIAGANWLPLHAVAADALRQERILMAPTLLTLLQLSEALRQYGSLTGLQAAQATGLLTPVRPRMLGDEERSWIVFPWDARDGEQGSHGWRNFSSRADIPGRINSRT